MSAAASELQKVTDEVIIWSAFEPAVKVELYSTAVKGGAGWVLLDPIPLAPGAMAELAALVSPAAIVLTNGNHSRAAAEYRERFQVPILAHADAVPELEVTVDREVSAGDTLAGNLMLHGIPGAGAGEIALYAPGQSLHIGDALINMEAYGFTFLPDKYCRNADEMKRSLAELAHLDFQLLTFAHGLPLAVKAQERFSHLFA